MDPDERRGGEELGGLERREIINRLYYVRKKAILKKRGGKPSGYYMYIYVHADKLAYTCLHTQTHANFYLIIPFLQKSLHKPLE